MQPAVSMPSQRYRLLQEKCKHRHGQVKHQAQKGCKDDDDKGDQDKAAVFLKPCQLPDHQIEHQKGNRQARCQGQKAGHRHRSQGHQRNQLKQRQVEDHRDKTRRHPSQGVRSFEDVLQCQVGDQDQESIADQCHPRTLDEQEKSSDKGVTCELYLGQLQKQIEGSELIDPEQRQTAQDGMNQRYHQKPVWIQVLDRLADRINRPGQEAQILAETSQDRGCVQGFLLAKAAWGRFLGPKGWLFVVAD